MVACLGSNYVLEGNETQVDDWIDESIAEWIQSETTLMDASWGPAEERAALVFMHIPPYVNSMHQIDWYRAHYNADSPDMTFN